jgi:hypothetical protein
MAAQVLSDTRLVVGSSDISTFTGSFSHAQSVAMKEANVFGGGRFTRQYPGLKLFTSSFDGFADYDAAGISSAFTPAQLGSQQLVSILPTGGAAAGDVGMFGRQLISNINAPGGTVGEMATFGMACQSDTAWANGLVADPSTTRTTTANGAAFAMTGPTASQRVYAGLHVTAASGTTPSLTVTIQSATLIGFGSPTTRATFTAATTTGWQFISVAGAITDGFWRAVFTISGTTPSFTTTTLLGVA